MSTLLSQLFHDAKKKKKEINFLFLRVVMATESSEISL